MDRRAGHRRSSRRHGAVADHVAAVASARCPKEAFHGDQRCCDHWGFGSGVFDAGHKCLLGIMSRKISVRPNSADARSEQKDITKYFVPASTISAFIPADYPF
jgi:hypothetical protein